MNISGAILRMAGWRVDITVPDYPKCIICVAPHTSNWDFIIGKLAYSSVGRKAGFMMKSSWFFFPLGLFFKAIGGVPVKRQKGQSLVANMIERFRNATRLVIAITPEGTRKPTARWHTGFLQIAYNTGVPIVLGAIDFKKKEVSIVTKYDPVGDIETDMHNIKQYYKDFTGRHPSQFITDDK